MKKIASEMKQVGRIAMIFFIVIVLANLLKGLINQIIN